MYDALNVLMAMDIIKKQKKTILWVGLPQVGSAPAAPRLDEASELGRLRDERDRMRNVLMEKGQKQLELQLQERCGLPRGFHPRAVPHGGRLTASRRLACVTLRTLTACILLT